ncbi:MAG: MFS transporter [Caulobacterales bacterium]|nr:MFS transporter [Caulobacterales bacterium]
MADEQDAVKLSPHRWYVLIVLAIVYTIYNVDRNLVVILAEPIRAEFALNDTQLGLLTGMSFALAFAIAGIPLGFLTDRMNRTRLLAILLTVWSIVTAVCAFVRTFPTLILTRVAIGAAESGAAPTSLSILSDYFPKSQRGRAIGLFYLATPVGLALGFAIGGYLVGMVGWRNVFLIAGIPGVFLALLVLLTMREPVRGTFEPAQKGPALVSSLGSVLGAIGQKKTLLLLMLAAITIIMGQAGLSAFLPSLLVREFQLSLEHTGLFMAAIHGVGGAIGMPLGGFMSDYVSKRSLAFAPRMVSILVFMAAPLALAGCFAPNIVLTGVCFFIYSILIHTYLGPTLSTYLTIAPAELRGAMSAAILVGMNLFGSGVGPQVTGIVSDLFSHWGVDQPLRMAMLFPAACLFISAGLYLAASGTTAKDAEGIDMSDAPARAH